ncbi:MAG: hypothetical protein GWO11_00980 [Desulfuromonadales bacterium]|nr:hypothetical protein [Desulfuromonadales bacterium]NIR33084.1 hypothetical protein [Desulfuromonadales bacterium]NIS39322.1 hypothetical protein [Desulfuromonadales bacterium]
MKYRIAGVILALLLSGPAGAELLAPEAARTVGERAPIFSLVSDSGALIEYDKDYYGRHHLVLTFFPAAFTPV